MKLWIIGAGGLVGKAMIRLLKAKQINHVTSSHAELDICHSAAVEHYLNAHGVSHIINCAAYTRADDAETNQDIAFQVNRDAVAELAKAAKRHRCHLLHFSTDYVFDGQKTTPYLENDAKHPLNVYGHSKSAGEDAIMSIYPEACVLRTSSVFGHGGSSFVATILQLMRNRSEIKVVTDQLSRPSYVVDLAEAALQLINAQGIYHFANTGVVSWHQFAEGIREEALRHGIYLAVKQIHKTTSKEFGRAAIRPAYSVLSTAKYEALTGLKPRPWQECLKHYFIAQTEDSAKANRC